MTTQSESRSVSAYENAKAIAEDVIREDVKACMKGLAHPNLEWSKAVRLAADFLAILRDMPSETAYRTALQEIANAGPTHTGPQLAHMARQALRTERESKA